MLSTLYKIGEVHFRLLQWHDDYHLKAGFSSHVDHVSVIPANEIGQEITSKKLHQKGYRTCSTIVFPHSTNEIISLWR